MFWLFHPILALNLAKSANKSKIYGWEKFDMGFIKH